MSVTLVAAVRRLSPDGYVRGRIISARSPDLEHHAIAGLRFRFQTDRAPPGALVLLEVTDRVATSMLKYRAESSAAVLLGADDLKVIPFDEKIVVVPLSLLQELRGQIAQDERTRQALSDFGQETRSPRSNVIIPLSVTDGKQRQ